MPLTVKTWNILKYVDFCGKAPLTLKVNCLCFQFVSYFFQLVSMFADKLEPSMQTMGDSINLLATKAIAKKLLVWHLFATEFTLFASTSNSRSSKLQNSSQCFISMEYPCTVLFMIYSGDWILVIKILLEIMTPYAFVYTDLHFFLSSILFELSCLSFELQIPAGEIYAHPSSAHWTFRFFATGSSVTDSIHSHKKRGWKAKRTPWNNTKQRHHEKKSMWKKCFTNYTKQALQGDV